jgi:hypothetical protein
MPVAYGGQDQQRDDGKTDEEQDDTGPKGHLGKDHLE